MAGALREIIAAFGFEVDEKVLDVVESRIEGITESLGKVAAAFGGAVMIKAITNFTKEQIEAGLQTVMMSKRLGIAVDELETLALAADGVSFEALTTGIRFLNRNLGDAAEDGGEAQKEFAKLGVVVKDASGKIRPTVELFGDVAEKIAAMKSPAAQTAATMKIFGRGGAELLPFLQEGREGLEHARKAFVELGGGVSKGYLEKAKAAARTSHEFEFALRGLRSEVAEALIPGFDRLQQMGTKVVVGMRKLVQETTILKTIFPALALGGIGFAIAKFLSLRVAGSSIIGIFQAIGTGARAMGLAIRAAWTSGILPAIIAYAVFDDVFGLFTGKQSLIGQVVDAMFGFGTAADVVKEVTAAWKEFWGIFQTSHDGIVAANSEPPPTTFFQFLGDWIKAAADEAEIAVARIEWFYDKVRELASSGEVSAGFANQARLAEQHIADATKRRDANVDKGLGNDSAMQDWKMRTGHGEAARRLAAASAAQIANGGYSPDAPDLYHSSDPAAVNSHWGMPSFSAVAPPSLPVGGSAAPGNFVESHDSNVYHISVTAPGGTAADLARKTKEAVQQASKEATERRASMNAVFTQ